MVKHTSEVDNAQHEPSSDLSSRRTLNDDQSRLEALLHQRRILTQHLKSHGRCNPSLLFSRAIIYELLEYDDLAVFDAYAVYLLCLKRLSDEFVTDLEAYDLDGELWGPSITETRYLLIDVLALIVRCLTALDATKDAQDKLRELSEQLDLLHEGAQSRQSLDSLLNKPEILQQRSDTVCYQILQDDTKPLSRFGHARREIYPWSDYEPDRNSANSVREVNAYLADIAPSLEVKVTELPALNSSTGESTHEKWLQLGLFAKHNLKPGVEILREKSVLTAIRPLDAAICDACGQDLDGISFDEVQQCDGEDCDVTFCSEECKERAVGEYHRPFIEDEDDGEEEPDNIDSNKIHTPDDDGENSITPATRAHAPFCGNIDLHTIGRPTMTETAEWDLYFLLLTRTIAMSITQNTHPLELKETKHLWGDFTPTQDPSHPAPPTRTLPFSLTHNIVHPLDFFTELSQTFAPATPYSAWWLAHFDAWTLQTLFAKFRGVANAQQSTFDGQPERAAVHPGWCLANHSCAPNVRWTPSGVRKFFVLTDQEWEWDREHQHQQEREGNGVVGEQGEDQHQQRKNDELKWSGIKAGEEVLSHYTDVRLPVRERRERLSEVLGGLCRCERCMRESSM